MGAATDGVDETDGSMISKEGTWIFRRTYGKLPRQDYATLDTNQL